MPAIGHRSDCLIMNPSKVEHSQVSLRGLHFRVADTGGSGLQFMFQHGLCGASSQTIEAFPESAQARMVTLECRGHGQTPLGPEDQVSIATFADDVLALHDMLKLGTMVMGGISMGAAIALRIAVTRPDLVKALVVVRPAWSTRSAPANMRPNAVVGDLLASMEPLQAQAAFGNLDVAKNLAHEAPDNLASLQGFFSRLPIEATSTLLRKISADGPGVDVEALGRISIPTLVVGHAQDAIHPLAMAKELAALIPGAQFVEITPKAVSKEQYLEELHAAINVFLKEVTDEHS